MKTKIFIDFDDTLFNTAEVKKQMFGLLQRIGFSMEQILEAYKSDYRQGGFTIEGFLGKLGETRRFDQEKAKKAILSLFKEIGPFDDALKFLSGIDRDKYQVNLLTFGSPSHQKTKARISGLRQYFDRCYYTQIYKTKYLSAILPKKASFILIDDLMEVAVDIAKAFPNAEVYSIIRNAKPGNLPPAKNIKIIYTLKNLLGEQNA